MTLPCYACECPRCFLPREPIPRREATVEKKASDPERKVYFWHSEGVSMSTHVTQFTPAWCERHGFAFSGEKCPACGQTECFAEPEQGELFA